MRVLVCGGRDLDPNKVSAWLCANAAETLGHQPTFVIDGGAHGADQGSLYWRNIRRIPGKTYPADWQKHGKAAGPIRNSQMLKEGKPDAVIAFHGGAGTQDMVERARRANIRIIEAAGNFDKAGSA